MIQKDRLTGGPKAGASESYSYNSNETPLDNEN